MGSFTLESKLCKKNRKEEATEHMRVIFANITINLWLFSQEMKLKHLYTSRMDIPWGDISSVVIVETSHYRFHTTTKQKPGSHKWETMFYGQYHGRVELLQQPPFRPLHLKHASLFVRSSLKVSTFCPNNKHGQKRPVRPATLCNDPRLINNYGIEKCPEQTRNNL